MGPPPGIRLLATLALFLAAACQTGESDIDPPDESEVTQSLAQSASNYTFPTGSLIIPMDITYQDGGMFKAYGLVYKLLQGGIPVSWVIKPGKSLCTSASSATCISGAAATADFTVSATDFVTNAAINPTHAYRGGPFVIDQAHAAAAAPVITAWNAALAAGVRVTVHRTTAQFTGFVKRQLVAAPSIAMFQDGNEDIAVKYLVAAGIPDSTGDYAWPATSPDLLTPAQVAGPSCPRPAVTIAATPGGATQTGNVATYTTTAAHNLVLGDVVVVAGVGVAGYNGTMTVTAVPSATRFSAVLRVTGLAASGNGSVTEDCQTTPHTDGGLFDSTQLPAYCQMMSMHYGVKQADTTLGREVIREYRAFLRHPVHLFGECQAVNAIENNTSIPFTLAPSPSGATMVGNTATFETITSHPFVVGETISIQDVVVAGYNGSWVVTSVPTSRTFTATLPVSGLGASGAGTARNYNGLFLTTAGYLIGADPAPLDYHNSGEPFAQLDGAFTTVPGSERSYSLPAGTSYKAQDVVFMTQQPTIGVNDLWMTGYLDGQCSTLSEFCDPQFAQGKVSYLGGHEYGVATPISSNAASQGTRLFLNALLEAPCATDLGVASVGLYKTAPASTNGNQATYTITAFNNGSATASNLVITDPLPTNVAFVPAASQRTITAISRTANVVTVTTSAAHPFAVGNRVIVTGVTSSTFDGRVTVTQVVSATQFRYAQTGADATSSGGRVALGRDGICVGTTAQCDTTGGGVVTFDLGTLGMGQSTSVTFDVRYQTAAVYTNTAQASYKAGTTTFNASSNTTSTCYYAGNPAVCATGCDANAPACGNGCDDDGDGLIDFPDDAGCDSTIDDDETTYVDDCSVVKARVLVVMDTSGSMMWNTCRADFTGGDGSLSCPGNDVACGASPGCDSNSCGNGIADDSRLFKVKRGISNAVNGFGEVEWGLMKFRQVPTPFSCGTVNVNKNDGGWQGAGASPCDGFAAGDLVVKFDPENINSLLAWMDGSTNYAGTPPPGKDFELRASGNTPLGGSLLSARDYIAASRSSDCPQVAACRPYRVIVVTDGAETCAGDPVNQAGLLFGSGDGDGAVPVHVIGFSTPEATTIALLNQIASTGGTTNFIPADNDAQLSSAIESIVESTILKELCNDADDDCDGRIDEDFPDKGAMCTNGAQGACARSGVRVCRSDGKGTECNALAVSCVNNRLIDGNGNDLGPCVEVCNNADDDCDGKIDEAPAMNCQPCVPSGETCNNKDDDCDSSIDENLTRQCGTGTCLGTETCSAGSFVGCTAQTPTTETCNGQDDDCDGLIDGFTVECSDMVTSGGPGSDNPGHSSNNPIPENICRPGTKTCPVLATPQAGNSFSACGGETRPCNGLTPCTDPCNGLDDDCDNKIDEDFTPADCSTNCGVGQTACTNGQITCTSTPQTGDATCNNVDDDCDSKVDEDWKCPDLDNDSMCDPCGEGLVCGGEEKCINGLVQCVGSTIGNETCNCNDDDCDTMVDEGTTCPSGSTCVNCQCAFPCSGGEFPCPLGKKCEVTQNGNFCVDDPCFNVSCPNVNGNKQTCVPNPAMPNEPQCVDTCSVTTCQSPLVCHAPSGECKPDDCSTFPERCGATEACVNGQCVSNPCQGVTCDNGEYCVSGTCVASCADMTCPAGQRCRLGVCETDPCGKQCPFGQACNDATGQCIEDPCKFRECPQGQWCNPNNGQCEDDPCVASNVMCPDPSEVCRGGSCYDADSLRPDAGNEAYVTVGGGGGCTTGSGSSSGLILALGLLLLRVRRAPARGGAR